MKTITQKLVLIMLLIVTCFACSDDDEKVSYPENISVEKLRYNNRFEDSRWNAKSVKNSQNVEIISFGDCSQLYTTVFSNSSLTGKLYYNCTDSDKGGLGSFSISGNTISFFIGDDLVKLENCQFINDTQFTGSYNDPDLGVLIYTFEKN